MNRRDFLVQSGATITAATLPAGAVFPKAATPVPANMRFWAVYMSQLHGTCSPKMLATMTKVSEGAAQSELSKLVSQGVLQPAQMLTPKLNVNTRTTAPNTTDNHISEAHDRLRAHLNAGPREACINEPNARSRSHPERDEDVLKTKQTDPEAEA